MLRHNAKNQRDTRLSRSRTSRDVLLENIISTVNLEKALVGLLRDCENFPKVRVQLYYVMLQSCPGFKTRDSNSVCIPASDGPLELRQSH